MVGIDLVKSDPGPALHVSVEQPFYDEERALGTFDFVRVDGKIMLSWE